MGFPSGSSSLPFGTISKDNPLITKRVFLFGLLQIPSQGRVVHLSGTLQWYTRPERRPPMPISSPSYILRTLRRGCYYFRMKVLVDLQPCVGKKELRTSLQTGYLADSKSESRLIAGGVQQLFRRIKIATPNYHSSSYSH